MSLYVGAWWILLGQAHVLDSIKFYWLISSAKFCAYSIKIESIYIFVAHWLYLGLWNHFYLSIVKLMEENDLRAMI